MPFDIQCPACGETERLEGQPVHGAIEVTCGACGAVWSRDPTAACPNCGGSDLIGVPKRVVEKVRGDQMSVVGFVRVQLCRACDAELVARFLSAREPLPPDAMPVSSRSSWGGAEPEPTDPPRPSVRSRMAPD